MLVFVLVLALAGGPTVAAMRIRPGWQSPPEEEESPAVKLSLEEYERLFPYTPWAFRALGSP